MDLPRTEARNPDTLELDRLTAREVVAALQREDARAVDAAAEAREAIAALVELAAGSLQAGGRLVLAGAGTSGRLALLEAAECPPTFSTRPEQVVALLAGGSQAFMKAVEGAEDDREQGRRDALAANVEPRDLVIGVTASGRTPYVLGVLDAARDRGARLALVACSPPPAGLALDSLVLLDTGPEALAGSTRLKAGTATKVVLNAVTTGAMVLLGKVHGNLMVDVAPTNRKLRDRAKRIVREIAGVADDAAAAALEAAGGHVKPAVLVARLGLTPAEARARLEKAQGFLRRALEGSA